MTAERKPHGFFRSLTEQPRQRENLIRPLASITAKCAMRVQRLSTEDYMRLVIVEASNMQPSYSQ